MGKVVFEDPVHHISGKISRKYRTCYNYRKWSPSGSEPLNGLVAPDVRPDGLHRGEEDPSELQVHDLQGLAVRQGLEVLR